MKEEKDKPKLKIKTNPKIEEIVKDYPESIIAVPRGAFEEQLRKHLIKHKIK